MTIRTTCAIHNKKLVMFCPSCVGGIRSVKKAEAARRNGKLGGRPSLKKAKH